jgi:hypothetical protein
MVTPRQNDAESDSSCHRKSFDLILFNFSSEYQCYFQHLVAFYIESFYVLFFYVRPFDIQSFFRHSVFYIQSFNVQSLDVQSFDDRYFDVHRFYAQSFYILYLNVQWMNHSELYRLGYDLTASCLCPIAPLGI